MSKSPDLIGNRSLTDTIKDIRYPRPLPETGWIHVGTTNPALGAGIAPDFEGSWDNVGVDAPPAGFYLAPDGEVRFRGVVTGDVAGTTIFTLPEGYRPEYDTTFIVPQVSEDALVAKIIVRATGEVEVIHIES